MREDALKQVVAEFIIHVARGEYGDAIEAAVLTREIMEDMLQYLLDHSEDEKGVH